MPDIDQIFKVVNVAGWFIGIFAVLVGAFGIANIMFVSVKERTSIIGIQKALGQKAIISSWKCCMNQYCFPLSADTGIVTDFCRYIYCPCQGF